MKRGGDGATSSWVIRLLLCRSSPGHQVPKLKTGFVVVFMFVYSHNSQSGVAASSTDSVLGPCGCREVVCPPFSFFFSPSPLAVTLCEVWRRNICLARPPFQMAGVCAREKSELERASGDVGAQQLLGLPSWPSIVSSSLCPSNFMGLWPFCGRQPRPNLRPRTRAFHRV